MRKTENFRPENRGAHGREYEAEYRREAGRYGKNNRRENIRADRENIYRELSGEGQRFCAAAGLVEEIIVLAAFGIRVSTSPFLVLAFLWVLFVILTAAALIGASCLLDWFAGLRPDPRYAAERRYAGALSASRRAATGGRGCGAERIAA